MARVAAQALAWARGQHKAGGNEWEGLCLMFVRSCYGIDAFYPSAAAAWEGARFKHRETDGAKVPRGVPYFWTGGSQGFGHIVLSAGGGMCWSNDIKSRGGISLTPINEITTRWRQTPRGWAEDLNNVRIWDRPEPAVVDVSDLMRAFKHDPPRPGDEGTEGSRIDVRRFERALSRKGYLDARYIDGSYGTLTVAGMRRFQRDHGLDGDGAPTFESVKAVGRGRYRVRE
jgi:hypothetical protein